MVRGVGEGVIDIFGVWGRRWSWGDVVVVGGGWGRVESGYEEGGGGPAKRERETKREVEGA